MKDQTEDSKACRILVLHGPNLNLLGERNQSIYGKTTLNELNDNLKKIGLRKGCMVDTEQSNSESRIIDLIQERRKIIDGLIINPAALTHTSVALRDALEILDVPIIEVHISNPYSREPFRRRSLIADIASGRIMGLGVMGYYYALEALLGRLDKSSPSKE